MKITQETYKEIKDHLLYLSQADTIRSFRGKISSSTVSRINSSKSLEDYLQKINNSRNLPKPETNNLNTKEQVIFNAMSLLQQGKSYRSIVEQTGISIGAINSYRKKLGIIQGSKIPKPEVNWELLKEKLA